MAYEVSVEPEAKGKAVKTKPIQLDLDGKEVKEHPEPICPFLGMPCIKEGCRLWVNYHGAVACAFEVMALTKAVMKHE